MSNLHGGPGSSDKQNMRVFFVLSCAALTLAQPAKVREETAVRRGPEGEVIGQLALGADALVVSRVTTESGSWCRVTGAIAGSVPCKALLISAPPPVPEPPPAPANPASRLAAKPVSKPAAPPPPPLDLGLIEHPTPAQIRRAFPGHGDPRTAQPTTPQSSVLQQYKFPGDAEISVTLWLRPTGTAGPVGDADLAKKLDSQATSRPRPHLLIDGRRLRWTHYKGDFHVTGKSPDGDFEWTMVYTTTEDPQDVTSYVLAGAATLDRILFGRR